MAESPSVDLSKLDVTATPEQLRDAGDAVASAAIEATKDAAYTAIGLGILAYQRIQVRRREIEKTLRS